MKRLSILLTATFFLLSGIQTLSAKKKKKDSKEPDVHLRVDLDRTILPAGKKGKDWNVFGIESCGVGGKVGVLLQDKLEAGENVLTFNEGFPIARRPNALKG